MALMELTVGVVSDLHCHHSSNGYAETLLLTDAPRIPRTHHPVSALLDLISNENLRAEVMLMPGDITNKVDPQGMISGWGFTREIAEALGASTIAATLGNHDVISRIPSDDPFSLPRNLYPQFPVAQTAAFDEFWSKGFCHIESEMFRLKSERFMQPCPVRGRQNIRSVRGCFWRRGIS